MIRWFKITFLNYCPECMEKHWITGAAGVDCWEELVCLNIACEIGHYNREIYG